MAPLCQAAPLDLGLLVCEMGCTGFLRSVRGAWLGGWKSDQFLPQLPMSSLPACPQPQATSTGVCLTQWTPQWQYSLFSGPPHFLL